MNARVLLAIATAGLLAGCMVGPDYVRPAAPMTAAYKEEGWKIAEPRDDVLRGPWWTLFGDPLLDSLVERVSVSNQNVRAAEAQYRQSRALVQQARAGLFPTLDLDLATTRGRAPSLSNRPSLARGPVNNYDAGLIASWEPDLWGRVRRAIESNEASWQASAADLELVRLSSQAELAVDYFNLREADLQKKILEDTVAAYERSLQLTRNRYAVGVVGKVDVVQAEAQLKSAQAQLLDIGVVRAQLEHAIAVLIGEPPASLSIPRALPAASIPDIPPGLPSELLERRPDIAAAERRVAAANAQIGVAQAARYPSLTLSAAGGYRTTEFSELLTLPTRYWALGAALAQPLFDAGLRRAVVAQTIAAYDGEVALYRQTVLTGFQEVEDNLVALRILADEARVQDEAVRAAREAVALTDNQYRAGTVSFLNVIAAQTIALNNERTAASLLGRRLVASVQLVRAIGGGWNAEELDRVRLTQGGAGAPAASGDGVAPKQMSDVGTR